jgi:hypothetical protein
MRSNLIIGTFIADKYRTGKNKEICNYPGCQVQARPGAMAVIKESNS